MRKFILFLTVFGIGMFHFSLPAQTLTPEFEFQLYFEDAAGNRDTITLGHSPLATNLINEEFGEENILGVPWDSVFEVRASNVYWEGWPFADTALIQTKREIVNIDEVGNNYITFDIKATNWPVTISWDSTRFHGLGDTLQFTGTWMTPIHYGVWWDGGSKPTYFYNQDEMVISTDWQDLIGYDYEGSITYYQDEIDTIYIMWFSFQDSSAFGFGTSDVNTLENNYKPNKISFSPNPFDEFFSIKDIEAIKVRSIQIYDLNGRKQQHRQEKNNVFLPNSSTGIYMMEIGIEDQQENYYYKLIKK